MNKKINIAIVFGGKSVEHEVSLLSARNVISALDRKKYNVSLIGIDKDGQWHFRDEETYLVNPDDPKAIELGQKKGEVELFSPSSATASKIDVIFPVLHGTNGEDGTLQGVLTLADIPFVGADVLGSAVGMDKDVMKRLLRDAKIPIADFLTLHQHTRHLWPLERVLEHIPFPLFVKPANSGSSIGVSKVKNPSGFEEALDIAFQYDRKILIEEAIEGREIQCSVLGNEYPIVSLPCEIIPKGDFHSYSSKYLDPQGAEYIIPVELPPKILSKVQATAIDSYKVLCCEGMARVDMFLKPNGEVLLNEINTIPGLTSRSPYARMWQASGMGYSEMLDRLIQFAIERQQKKQALVTNYEVKNLISRK